MRKSYQQGLLGDRGASARVELLPVHVAGADVIASASRPEVSPPRSSGAIHMEFPGKALVTVEGSPSVESLRVILECLLR